VRVLTLLVKKEQAKQESLNKELRQLPEMIANFQSQVAYTSMMMESRSPREGSRSKNNHTTIRTKRPFHGLESHKRSSQTGMAITNTKGTSVNTM
jgi:hypothetical protein